MAFPTTDFFPVGMHGQYNAGQVSHQFPNPGFIMLSASRHLPLFGLQQFAFGMRLASDAPKKRRDWNDSITIVDATNIRGCQLAASYWSPTAQQKADRLDEPIPTISRSQNITW